MIRLASVFIAALISCSTAQKKATPAIMIDPETNIVVAFKDSVSPCIRAKIDSMKKLPKHEQPQNVIEYEYKGKKVYYITMPCCDFFNEVYDSSCKLLGHPDGGFTGRGDGTLPDFATEKKKEKIVWQAPK